MELRQLCTWWGWLSRTGFTCGWLECLLTLPLLADFLVMESLGLTFLLLALLLCSLRLALSLSCPTLREWFLNDLLLLDLFCKVDLGFDLDLGFDRASFNWFDRSCLISLLPCLISASASARTAFSWHFMLLIVSKYLVAKETVWPFQWAHSATSLWLLTWDWFWSLIVSSSWFKSWFSWLSWSLSYLTCAISSVIAGYVPCCTFFVIWANSRFVSNDSILFCRSAIEFSFSILTFSS